MQITEQRHHFDREFRESPRSPVALLSGAKVAVAIVRCDPAHGSA